MQKKDMLFVHDHVFTRVDGRVYSAAAFPVESWDRYLDFFHKVDVVARHDSRGGNIDGLVLSSRKGVDFFLIKDCFSKYFSFLFRSHRANELIRERLGECAAVVARLPSENGNIAVKLATKAGKPVAVEVVGCAFDAYRNYGGLIAKLYAPIAYIRMRKSVKRATQVLYVTSKYLQDRYPTHKDVVSISASNVNLPDAFYFENNEKSNRIYSLNDKLTLGLIGNFKTSYKGIDTAIKAVSYLRCNGLDVKLKILGSGEESFYHQLAKRLRVEERVQFCGVLPNGKPVLDWLASVDIYIQPSRTEGLPRSLIEAMSQGKTCFGSRVGGIPELLDWEYIHRVGDHEDLGSKILSALKNQKITSFNIVNFNNSRKFRFSKLESERYVFFKKLFDRA